jgi:hypothetical protein
VKKWRFQGFYTCVVDLEDELIRALGAATVEDIIESQGEIAAFRTLQKQPEWRGQSVEAQLRLFLGSGATRKIRYARLLVDALDPARIPAHSGWCFLASESPPRLARAI